MAGRIVAETDEIMDGDLRTRVIGLEHSGAALNQRMTTIEAWRQQSDIADARKEEQFKHMDSRFGSLDTKIDGVERTLGTKIDGVSGSLSWIGRLVIGGVVAAVLAYFFRGGVNIPPL